MPTANEKSEALAAIEDFAELAPMIRAGLRALAGSGTNDWLNAFPAPQHPDPDWTPGRNQLPPDEVLARLDAIAQGIAVAGEIVSDVEVG